MFIIVCMKCRQKLQSSEGRHSCLMGLSAPRNLLDYRCSGKFYRRGVINFDDDHSCFVHWSLKLHTREGLLDRMIWFDPREGGHSFP